MSKKITLFILLFLILFSCNGLEDSRGDINALTIISSKEDRDYCEHIIRHFFENKFINTPQKEYVYNINWMNLHNINQAKMMKNVLFLSLTHPIDSTADVLVDNILKANNLSANISSIDDMFSKRQKVILLQVTDAVELEKQLESNISWIISEYNQNIYNNYYNYLLSKKSNNQLEQLLNDKFNISIFIQRDYSLINEDDALAWIGRGHPYRWIVFYKIKNINRSKDPYLIFQNIIDNYNLGITISKHYMKKTNLSYVERNINIFRGIYNHVDSQTGGPFALYMLDNIDADEVILVASIINNPGNKKINHLLEMDALIGNIKFQEIE